MMTYHSTRRRLLMTVFLLTCSAIVASDAQAADGAADRPNIVLILADDLGYGDLGCYGHPRFRTPHLDRLATQGARLSQFNTPAPFCAPTRASLLTGHYPVHCGLPLNPAPDGRPPADALALPDRNTLLPAYLKQAGYATAMIGKWHLGHRRPESWPVRRGFDEYLGILYSNDMRPVQLIDGDRVVEYPLVQATLTERYTKRALEFIERQREQPFFLYLAHAMPHKPLAASEHYYKKSDGGLYGDVMAELDAGVGAVLDALHEVGLDERTLVLFTSDNGAWFGGSTGGLRGMKGSTYEGGVRVPLIAHWPGRIPAGHVSDQLAGTIDLFPTVAQAAGIPLPGDRKFDGRDIWPLLTGAANSPHQALFGHQASRLATVRDGRWKLHVLPPSAINLKPGADGRWLDPRAPDGVTILAPREQYNLGDHPGSGAGVAPAAMQLFDLSADPAETTDLAAQHPDQVNRLKACYDAILPEVPRVEEVKRTPIK